MRIAAGLVAAAALATAGVAALSPSVTTATTCAYQAGGALPDPSCTPGATNPAVTQQTISQTICVTGWTAIIRPPQSVTGPEKQASMRQYGVTDPSLYEYDHLISLELGGAPNSTANLWPEPHTVANGQGSYAKDGVENGLKRMICNGQAILAAAQYWIAHDWRQIVVGRPLPPTPPHIGTTATSATTAPATTAATTTSSTGSSTTAPTSTVATAASGCKGWPRRHWLHHRYHRVCRAGYFTTP